MTTADDSKDMASLWTAYKKAHDKEVRDQIVEHYLTLVNIIAGRLAISLPAHVDRDDLISSGYFGLLDVLTIIAGVVNVSVEVGQGHYSNAPLRFQCPLLGWMTLFQK